MSENQAEREARINKIKAALDFNIQQIVDETGLEYQLVWRTLTNRIKRWDSRHDQVLEKAEESMRQKGFLI